MSDVKIIIKKNGSLRIEGDVELLDDEGKRIATPEGRPFSLCRCGASSRKPFCDGSHRDVEFDGTLAV